MTAWALILVVVAGSPSDPPPPLDAPASSVPDTPIPAPDPILETRSTPFEVGAWQALAGGTACFLLACPGAPLTLGLSVLAAPAVAGWMTTTLGDSIGTQRAPWLWTMVGSYMGAILFGGTITAATVAGLIVSAFLINSGAGFTGGQILVLGLTVGGVINLAATSIATGAGAAFAYALTAEPKQLGDDGTAPSGFSSPGHPDDGKAPDVDEEDERAQLPRPPQVVAMAY